MTCLITFRRPLASSRILAANLLLECTGCLSADGCGEPFAGLNLLFSLGYQANLTFCLQSSVSMNDEVDSMPRHKARGPELSSFFSALK